MTFLLTDIEGSTALLSRIGPRRFGEMIAAHNRILNAITGRHGGVPYRYDGDGFIIAFGDAHSALMAAVAIQDALAEHDWGSGPRPRVRMALHRGDALVVDGEYVALALHQATRVLAAPHGGQVVCTADVLSELSAADENPHAHLIGAYWLRDFTDAVRLYQVQREPSLVEFPALRVPRADLTNIGGAEQLVGRELETRELETSLRASRLVTVTGAGGVGKTSLAIAVALRLAARGEAAWLAEFAGVEVAPADQIAEIEQRLVSALARSLGVTSEEKAAVFARLGSRAATLVLDNCEHVLDAASALATDILRACDNTRILATSREPLGLNHERVVAVAPLALPAADASLQKLRGAPSVELFVQRATAANPAFRLTESNAAVIASLCRELDGLPLALELAGTASRFLTPADMLARLKEAGTLPSQPGRRRSARHSNLAALVDWSLASCTSTQSAVFRWMGTFVGPVPADVVAAVCAVGGLAKWDVLDALNTLVDKHLVVARLDDDRTGYDMLETLRRAARTKLEAAGEHDAAFLSHAQWLVRATRAAGADGRAGGRASEATLVVEAMAALDRAERLGLATSEWAELACSAVLRLGLRSPSRTRDIAAALLRRADINELSRARVCALLTQMAMVTGAPDQAHLARQAVEAARRAGDPRALVIGLAGSVIPRPAPSEAEPAVVTAGRQPAARIPAELAEAEALLPQFGDGERQAIESVLSNAIGLALAAAGDLTGARARYLQFGDISRAIDDDFNAGISAYNIAELDEMSGDLAAAVAGYQLAAERLANADAHLHVALANQARAMVLERIGNLPSAADVAADAVLSARRSGDRRLLGRTLLLAARIGTAVGDVSLAAASAAEVLGLPVADDVRADARQVLSALEVVEISDPAPTG